MKRSKLREVKPLIGQRTREVIEAIERVFRTTHKREMNSEERKSFQLPPRERSCSDQRDEA